SSGPVVVMKQSAPSNGILFSVVGPRITAAVTPTPNANGWNSSNVTVTFACTATDVPLSFCTSPQTVSWNGANIRITGRAIDQNGVTATMVVTLNVDLSGPVLHVYRPSATAVFAPGTTSVTVKGSAVDVMSGLASVTCAGAPGSIVGQNFTCSAAVQDGTTTVRVEAMDLAGRLSTQNVAVVVSDVPPTTLTISPATVTLFVGAAQPLAVIDERGRTVAGGAWTT